MLKKILLKNAWREYLLFRDRVLVAWLIILLLLLGLVLRLVFLQVLDHEHFTTLSENNRLKILPLPPPRGLIYDRNGVVLAENQATYSLEIIPEQVPKDGLEDLLEQLNTILPISDDDRKRFYKYLKHKRRFEPVPLRYKLTDAEVARFSVRSFEFPGVNINTRLTRFYPLGKTGNHALGYVGRINQQDLKRLDTSEYSGTRNIGKIGVEKYYEDVLHGRVGLQQVETNVRGRILRVVKREDPIPGDNLYLNLDIVLQRFAEQLLEGERGALVALEPTTGGVLALVSVPHYDPNLFVNGIDHKSYKELLQSPGKPLLNRAIRGQYPPGSTIKAFVGMAGMEYNQRQAHQKTWCPGWYSLPGKEHKYRDWKHSGHGHVNFYHAVEQSCDVYFYTLAHDLGINRLSNFMQRFSFGHLTEIDISNELPGLMPTREWKHRRYNLAWYPGETLISGIGQGFVLATPTQLAMATATLSMRGKTHHPRLAFMREAAETRTLQTIPSRASTQVELRNEDFWTAAIEAMQAVVHGARGTARKQGADLPYRMAGKTGTAQVINIEQNAKYDADKLKKKFHDHALFVAFAPVDDPKIALAVIVENGGSGSSAAAPIARKVIDFYLRQRLQLEFDEAPAGH